ncbi:MAG: TraR/DksA C4-type zinc finger protein [Candidatus Magasanikbacteria bacterium]|nr:TraR/DksA C4-type zinc finger protein [Candidatus Magasanikbacteria bacterium]
MAKSNFNKEFLDKIKTTLLEEKDRLEKELARFSKRNPHTSDSYDSTFPEYGDKDDENAAEVAEYAAEVPLEESFEKTLRDTIIALKRLEEGGYGVCKYCKKPIEEKRLLARPTSSACVSCKKAITQEL